jgi:hypothetical protein
VKRLSSSSVLIVLWLAMVSPAVGQLISVPPLPSGPGPQRKVAKVIEHYQPGPSLLPAFTIPLSALGFSAPGDSYLLRREHLVSLDFLSEDRLLFTFHVSGLMTRDAGDADDSKQQIRAVVVDIPGGKIETQADWVVPDRLRYLWMLDDGSFLLRVKEGLERGDAQLKLTPYLSFPGRLMWVQMDPKQQILLTNSRETADAEQPQGTSGTTKRGGTIPVADAKKPAEKSLLVVRTVKRDSGEVMHVSRFPWTSQTADFPMNSEGYVELSHEKDVEWLLKMSYHAGGGRTLVHLTSTCKPSYDFISDTELLVSRCDPDHGHTLSALSTSGDSLWETKAAVNTMWPLLVLSPNSPYVARESLLLKRPVNSYKRLLRAGDFDGQMVRVLNAATGKVVLEAPLTPIFDGGGNVAMSQSGQRVAILSGGAIQVFQLPAVLPAKK